MSDSELIMTYDLFHRNVLKNTNQLRVTSYKLRVKLPYAER